MRGPDAFLSELDRDTADLLDGPADQQGFRGFVFIIVFGGGSALA